jgi:hypothetical protein
MKIQSPVIKWRCRVRGVDHVAHGLYSAFDQPRNGFWVLPARTGEHDVVPAHAESLRGAPCSFQL